MVDQHYGYPGSVNAEALSLWLPNVSSSQYSVLGEGDGKVTVNPSVDRGVFINSGWFTGDGILDFFEADTPIAFSTVASGSRWDMIVLRRIWNATPGASTSSFVVIPGSANKTLPARNNNKGVMSDQPIALCRVQAGQTTVQEIVDLRVWSHNGGSYANDDLVKNYLSEPGTTITIGPVVWLSKVTSTATDDSLAWEKQSELLRIPLLAVGGIPGGSGNSTPPPGTHFYMQAGSTVLKTDGNGFGKIVWPIPFPNGLINVQLTNGDDFAFNDMGIGVAGGNWGTSPQNRWQCAFNIWGSQTINGVKTRHKSWPNRTIRVNWTAIGW